MSTTNGKKLAVRLARFTNIGGIEGTLEIRLGDITYLEGDNGLGKSSVVDGLAALCGAPVTDLLNQDAEEGEVYLELTDDTWFRRRITASGTNELKAGHPDQGSIGRAASWLRATLSAASLSPAEFLNADDDQALEYILRAAPLKVTAEEIAAAMGEELDAPEVDTDGHALTVLDAAIRQLYDERRKKNSTAKEARATIAQLQQSIPEDVPDPDALAARVEDLESDLEEIRESGAAAKAEAEAKVREEVDQGIAALDESLAEHDAEVTRLEEALRKAKTEREKVRGHKASLVEERDAAAARAAKEAADPWRERYTKTEAELKAAREALQSANRAEAALENTRKMLAAQEKKAEAAHARSQALTQAMARLEALKAAKAADLPVEGVSIEDGRLLIGGVPAHRANTAERVRVALDASTAQDTRVPFVFADHLESLSTKTREQVEAACRERGIQVLGARVTDDERLMIRAAGEKKGTPAEPEPVGAEETS